MCVCVKNKKDFNNLNKNEKLVREKLKIPLIFNSELTKDHIIITKIVYVIRSFVSQIYSRDLNFSCYNNIIDSTIALSTKSPCKSNLG